MKKSLFSAILYFVSGLIICCITISFFLNDTAKLYAASRSEKLAILAKSGPPFCSAAFGSSHIYNGFDPRVFDSYLKNNGISTNSLNLGVEGGSQTEQYNMAKIFITERNINSDYIKPCFVILEITAGVNLAPQSITHPRVINIYNRDTSSLAFDFVSSKLPLKERLGRSFFIIGATLLHYSNLGMLSNELLPPEVNQTVFEQETRSDQRGLMIEPFIARDNAAVKTAFESRPASPASTNAVLTKGVWILVSKLHQLNGGQNYTYLYIVGPKLSDMDFYTVYPACLNVHGTKVNILNVAQPVLYPQLYRPEFWHDTAHLNALGAAVFTMLIAKQIVSLNTDPSPISTCASF